MISGFNHRLIGRGLLQGERLATSAQTYRLAASAGELFHLVERNAARPQWLWLVGVNFRFRRSRPRTNAAALGHSG
jgi:hypothetical protein